MKTVSKTVLFPLLLVSGLLLALTAPAAAVSGSYGYLRVVEGTPTLTPADGERAGAEINQPVLAGDHLWVPDHGHVEIVLADHNLLRVDGGSELVLERQAGETDRDDQATVIRLLEGNVQLAVAQDSLGDQLPRIDTPNSTLYVQNYGIFRVTAERDGFSQLVVRRGTAQVVTDHGQQTVRAGEEAVIDDGGNDREAGIDVREAGPADSLERWARRLDDEAAAAERLADNGVDETLQYQSASLASYGSWIDVEGTRYWRPRVEAGWRPYWHGRWAYTPAGLTWIPQEPWGWVPSHYGSWNYLESYGWVWQPGYVWSPAWVYWYWGPSYVGWCPTSFYTSFYGSHTGVSFGFRSGVYGWASGDWDVFDWDFGDPWSFVDSAYFRDGYRAGYRRGYWDGHRDVRRYAVPIDHLRGHALERGVITTDTRPLRPNTWHDHGAVLNALNVRPNGPNGRDRNAHEVGGAGREIPDVTPFIARKPQLPADVLRRVAVDRPGPELDGTPLKPGTLGRPSREARGTGNGRPADRPGRVVIGEGANRDNPGRPADNGRTGTWSRPGRPAPSADGGAPRPGRSDRTERTGRPGRPVDNGPQARPERPAADNGRPTWQRPEAAGGASRPERSSPPVERPQPQAERPQPQPDRPQPPADRKPPNREQWRSEYPSRTDVYRSEPDRPQSPDRYQDRYSRPEPVYQPRMTRPEPRPDRAYSAPQRSESRPAPQARPSSPPPQRSQAESSRPHQESKPKEHGG